jgi:hypothetical protein
LKATGYNDGDEVYPCVVCHNTGDCAEFVDSSLIEDDEDFM